MQKIKAKINKSARLHRYAKHCGQGFVILFAVVISSILLAIGLGVSNIAYKEITFSTSARQTNDAFFAADTGAECALFNDKSASNSFKSSGGSGSVTCLGQTVALTNSGNLWSFTLPSIGNVSQSCAKVTVSKNTTTYVNTLVISKGYNNPTCSGSSSTSVERELDVTYSDEQLLSGGVPNPVAYWPLDRDAAYSADGVTITDSTGNGNTLTVNGGVSLAGPTGVIYPKEAANFWQNGAQYLGRADNSLLSTGDSDFTIVAWVNGQDLSGYRTIASKRDTSSNTEWNLIYDPTSTAFRFYTYNGSTTVGDVTASAVHPAQGAWYQVIAWRDGTRATVNIQVSSQSTLGQVYTADETGAPSDSTAQFKIGLADTADTSSGWFGYIDEVGFWKRVLTDSQRSTLWNGGAAWTYAP